MAYTIQLSNKVLCSSIKLFFVFVTLQISTCYASQTCPGFPGYCSESFPGQTCIVVCSRGRPNVPLCQSDGTWTDIPRCIEHDPGVAEQVPGLCPGISGYCSEAFIGQRCSFDCSFGPDIDSACSQDGTWEPYPTCAGDLRDTQDGCDGCPGPLGGLRNRTAEALLGISRERNQPTSVADRQVRPSFAGNIAFGRLPASTSKPKSFIPPQSPNKNFVPNLAAAGLRTTPSPRRPRPTAAPRTPPPRAQFPNFQNAPRQQPRQQPSQQQQPRFLSSNQVQQQIPQVPRKQFTQQQPAQVPRQQFPQQQVPQQQQQQQQPGTQGGFSSQQLDIIRLGLNRLGGFNKNFNQNQQTVQQPTQARQPQIPQQQPRIPQQQPRIPQQQPRIPQQQPRIPQQQPRIPQQQPRIPQQQPRIPQQQSRIPQQQPRIPQQQPQIPQQQPRVPQQQPRIPQRQQPQRLPVAQPAPQPRRPPTPPPPQPVQENAPQETTQLTALQRAILKNAGVTDIPKFIPKVQKADPKEPKTVQFLAEENFVPNQGGVGADGRFFGPFEVFSPDGTPVLPQGTPDLRAFPAIPEGQPPIGGPGVDPAFGPFQVVDL